MRYRKLDANGDYTFGQGDGAFLVESPEAVAQAAQTRLGLWAGEWFLDTTEGTPYATEILGAGTQETYDIAIKERIINTPGVVSIDAYASVLDGRALSVGVSISTRYGATSFNRVLA